MANKPNQRPAPGRSYPGLPPLGGWFTDEEVSALMKALEASMDWRQGFSGSEVAEFEAAFADYCGVEHAVALNSCGTGLDISMMCLDLAPGDEVISPAITFKATHLAIIGQGAKLVLCEIDPATFNVDPADVERRMTERTRAILPVHNNGLSAPMDDLEEIAARHPHPKHGPPKVIPDAARAAGATYRGTRVGKRGWMSIFSFQTSKNMTTLGEGGMITTDDPEVDRRARAYRAFGGGTELWGTNYRMTRLQAAVGLVQLRRLDEMNARRIDRAQGLTRRLEAIPELTLPSCPDDCTHVFYGYTVMVPPEWAGARRDRLCAELLDEFGVGTVVMNDVTPTQHPLIRDHVEGQATPVSDLTGKRLFCVSLHPLMTDDDLDYIAGAVADVVERARGWA
jgi:perosamine synthetase